MSTPEQIAANQANAQLSTGPRTEEGKAISSRNALATGLTGRTVLLSSDDLDEYSLHIAEHFAEYLPITNEETKLVQSIADSEWRLRRVLTIEDGLFAVGEREFADFYANEPRAMRSALIKTQTHLRYEREFKNLSIQEGRLLRQKAKCIAAFEELKSQRPKPAAKPNSNDIKPANGFEFSSSAAATPIVIPEAAVSQPEQANPTHHNLL